MIGSNCSLCMYITEGDLRLVRILWLILLLLRHDFHCLYLLLGKYLIIAYLNCLYMLLLTFLLCYVVNCLHRRIPIYLHLLPHMLVGYSCVSTRLILLASLYCSRRPVTQKFVAKLLCACPWSRSRHPNAPSGRFRDLRAHPLQNTNFNKYNKSGVYQLTCQDCSKKYIGQTSRLFHVKFQEPFQDFKYKNGKSNFAHLIDKGHSTHGRCHGNFTCN